MADKRNDPAPAQDADARRRQWLDEDVTSFAAQARWHERHVHPLADIRMDPV
jgi:antitoxin CcdA